MCEVVKIAGLRVKINSILMLSAVSTSCMKHHKTLFKVAGENPTNKEKPWP